MYSNRLIAAMLVLGVGCGHKTEEKKAPTAGPAVAVRVEPAVYAEWPDSFEATGTVRARTTTTIASRVMGYVREIRPQVGDRVTNGQLLVAIDARDLDTARRQAEAAMAEAKTGVPAAESAISSARARLELAQVSLKRMQDLLDKRSVSRQEFDEAASRAKVARSDLDMAQARRAQLDERIRLAGEGVRAAGIAAEFANVTAPFAGLVIARKAEPGTLASPGMPLLEIEREGAYRFEARVEESRLASVRVGMVANVRLDSVNAPLSARVDEIVPTVEEASRAFVAKLALPPHARIRTGLFGRAEFAAGKRRVLTVREGAAAPQGQLSFVMVAEGGVARMRLVKVGSARDGRVELLSGLSEGDAVVYPPVANLGDGARVEVRP